MSNIGGMLYLIVIIMVISGFMKGFEQSKKSALIMVAMSPVYLAIAQFIAPYSNSRGKFDALFNIGTKLGFNDQEASIARAVFVFVAFWSIFFILEFFTFKKLVEREKNKNKFN